MRNVIDATSPGRAPGIACEPRDQARHRGVHHHSGDLLRPELGGARGAARPHPGPRLSVGALPRLAGMLKVLAPIVLVMLLLQVAFTRGGDPVLLLATSEGSAYRRKGVPAARGRGAAARAHARRDQAHRPCGCLRRGSPYPLQVRLHLHHRAAVRARVHPGDERDHGGADGPRGRMRHQKPVQEDVAHAPRLHPPARHLRGQDRRRGARGRAAGLLPAHARESPYKRYPMLGADAAALACCVGIIALGILL